MKVILAIVLLFLSNVISVKGHCDMLIDCSVEIPSTSQVALKMLFPDGKSAIVFDDTVKQMQKEFRLEQLGEYQMAIFFILASTDSICIIPQRIT